MGYNSRFSSRIKTFINHFFESKEEVITIHKGQENNKTNLTLPASKFLNVEKQTTSSEKVEKLSLFNINNMEIGEKDSLKSGKGLSIFTPTEINNNVLIGKQVF